MKALKKTHWLLLTVLFLLSLLVAPAGVLAEDDPYADYPEMECRRIFVEYTVGEPVTITLKSNPAPSETVRYKWATFDHGTLTVETLFKDFSTDRFLTFTPTEDDHLRVINCFYDVNGPADPWYKYLYHAEFILVDLAKGLPHMPTESPDNRYKEVYLYPGEQVTFTAPAAQGANGKQLVYRWQREEMDGSTTFVAYTDTPEFTLTHAAPANVREWAGYYCLAGYRDEPTSFLDYNTYYSVYFLTGERLRTAAEVLTALSQGLSDMGFATASVLTQHLLQKLEDNYGSPLASTSDDAVAGSKLYDVILQMQVHDEWQTVTPEQFPKDGIKALLPYPEGTDPRTHDFYVAHLFEDDVNGFRAGDIEYPAVTKTPNGLSFTLMGTSPVLVSWTAAPSAPPATGDAMPLTVVLLLMAASMTAAVLLCRKKAHK